MDGDDTARGPDGTDDDASGTDESDPRPPEGTRPTHPDEVLSPMLLLRKEMVSLRVDVNAVHGDVGRLYDELAAVRTDLSALADALLGGGDDTGYDTLAVVHDQVIALGRRLDDLALGSVPAPAEAAPAVAPVRAQQLGTKQLGRELVRRLNPARPAFWRRVRRALG